MFADVAMTLLRPLIKMQIDRWFIKQGEGLLKKKI